MLEDFTLDVILRILSFLERRDLRNVGQCSRLLRLLTNQSLITRNILLCAQSRHEYWVKDSCFFDMSQMDSDIVRRSSIICDQEGLPTEICDESYVFTAEETLTYVKILQGFHDEPKREEVLEEHVMVTPFDSDNEAKTECQVNSMRAVSPTSSDYSKSSATSLFSDGPPRLSNSEWNSPIHELDHLSDHLSSGRSDCESSSSTESIAKLRSSTKVKDKAALFEKLILKDNRRALESQRKSNKKKSYGALSHLFEENNTDVVANKRKISQDYLKELARCNNESASDLTSLADEQNNFSFSKHVGKNDELKAVRPETEQGRRTKNKTRRIHRNRLKAFVTQGNKVLYEKI